MRGNFQSTRAALLLRASDVSLPSSVKKLDSELEKLREKRNDAAHETRIWKGLSPHEVEAVKRRCQFAQDFLEMTAR